MRGKALQLKVEQLKKAAASARSVSALREIVERLAGLILTDRRRRVTPEVRAAVLRAKNAGRTIPEMQVTFELSAPTLRKIVRDETRGESP